MPALEELESRLQTLLEVQLIRYLPGYNTEDRLFQYIASAMKNNLKDQDGSVFVPNLYVIYANPTTLSNWDNESQIVKELSSAIKTAGEGAGFHFLFNPMVTTSADSEMTPGEVHIIASYSDEGVSQTRGMSVRPHLPSQNENELLNGFFILGGTKIIPLNLPVINIGRRLDNQVVIDDPRVSRTHAQIRIVNGHFVLFDLNSSGGTFINGKRIIKNSIYSGDVISLAGVSLIFGQDTPSGRTNKKATTKLKSINSGDQKTDEILQIPNKPEKNLKKK